MLAVVTTWWTGLLIAVAIGLFAISFILKLREWNLDPLRTLRDFIHRPWFERYLLLFFICGMVQYAATKGTGNGSRSSGSESRDDAAGEIGRRLMRGGDSPKSGDVTNLCFTGISILTNGVELNVAWPTNLFTSGTTLDFFAKHQSLTNAWQWFAHCLTSPGMTNVTVLADWQEHLACTTNPPAMFFKVQDRASCASTMADADCDGLPDIYELNNGTNPYVSDYALAPKLTVGAGGDYSTLVEALAASESYSVVELSSAVAVFSETITLPSHPVLITGPQGGYARLYSSADIAMFLLDEGQGCDTLFRNLYVILTARNNFQSAFWIGGNLPWSGAGASPTFENVRVRALYPNVLHYGWHYYRDDGGLSQISDCVMNAAGSTSSIGVYSYNGPDIGISNCAFVNFPTNSGSCASWIKDGTNIVAVLPRVETNLSWAGYALDASYSSTVDSDEDGLSDYAEIRVYDTDPWLPDSDGDGLNDAEEIDAGTDPKNLYSFYRRVTVVTTATDSLANTTNYVAWGTSDTGWETNGISSCWTFPTTNVYDMTSSSGPMYVKSFRDLNRNGQYDPESDIILIRQVPPLDAISTFVLQFGDIDGDGVTDAVERQEGSNPYDGGSFRLNATVNCSNTDSAGGITNYLETVGCFENDRVSFVASGTLIVDTLLTNGVCTVLCWRDFNGNGIYDSGVDIHYSRTLTKSDNGKTIAITIGDADSDGQSDSSEQIHGTNPTDAKSYCFNLSFVEKGIFGTTNALTAELFFGTNVIAGPLTLTNRTWEVDVGHLIASNRETAVAYFWDDANSNGVRDVEECFTRQTFVIKGHENVLTNILALGTFDRDNDEMLDYWELQHADAGLSPTNAADAFLDPDTDGLINLHEFWAHCNPSVPDGSNTVLSVVARSIDERTRTAEPSLCKEKFVNYVNNGSSGIFVANTNFWLRNVDTTCASPWQNLNSGNQWAVTLITPKHVISASHHTHWAGCTHTFVGKSGQIYYRQVVEQRHINAPINTDICIGELSESLPTNDVLPVCFVPVSISDYIANGRCLPMVAFDQEEKAIVHEVMSIALDFVNGQEPKVSARAAFYEEVVSGDSSNPRFFLFGDQLALLNVFWHGGVGDGMFLASFSKSIQEAIDQESPGEGYKIKYIELGQYEKLP